MIPITKVRTNKICQELGIAPTIGIRFFNQFDANLINPDGISSTYCDGSTPALRLAELTTQPLRIGKFRGYRHGMVYFIASPNKLYSYDFEDDIATYIGEFHYSVTDIAMTANRFWFCYSDNPVRITEYFFDLRFPSVLNLSRNFNTALNEAAGLFAIDNDTIVIGGLGSIKVLDISSSSPVEISSIPISGRVNGDMVVHPADETMIVSILDGSTRLLRKYSLSTGQLLASRNVINNDDVFAMFNWKNIIYIVKTDGSMHSVNPASLQQTFVRTKSIGAATAGATNTPFRNNEF